MDVEMRILRQQVEDLGGAAHTNELHGAAGGRAAIETAVAAGLLERPAPGFLLAPGTDERIIRARHVRGRLTCASAAEILGYPLVERPGRIHVAVPTTRALRPSRTRPLTGMRIHREKRITPMTLDGFPLVTPAEVVARCLVCLDELDALAIADAALRRGDVEREAVEELLTGRRHGVARSLLASASGRARSLIESRLRRFLASSGHEVEHGIPIEGVGEVDFLINGRLVIETDGYEFHSRRADWLHDHWRDQQLLARGFVVLRLTYEDVMAGQASVLALIDSVLGGVAHSSCVGL